MGDYAKAELLLRQVLEIRKRVLGKNHSDYAQSLNNLGSLYKDKRDYARAEPLYLRALETWRRGENQTENATGLNNLATLYQDMGDYPKAEPLYRQAMDMRERVLGENHPDYAQSLNNLAVLYQYMCKHENA